MMTCLIGVAVLIASTGVSGSSPARAGALTPIPDIANISTQAITFTRHFLVSLEAMLVPPFQMVLNFTKRTGHRRECAAMIGCACFAHEFTVTHLLVFLVVAAV